MNKIELREKAFKIRDTLNQKAASNNVIREIIESKILDGYKKIGIYYPIKNEISLLNLIDNYPDKEFYLPKTRSYIEFIRYHRNDPLVTSRFGIPEPEGTPEVPEILLVPMVAANHFNYRLGYGGGYYDNYLKNFNGPKIGICYKELVMDFTPNTWDIPLDMVILG